MENFEKMENELTELVIKYVDILPPVQIIAILECKKLALAHLLINDIKKELETTR